MYWRDTLNVVISFVVVLVMALSNAVFAINAVLNADNLEEASSIHTKSGQKVFIIENTSRFGKQLRPRASLVDIHVVFGKSQRFVFKPPHRKDTSIRTPRSYLKNIHSIDFWGDSIKESTFSGGATGTITLSETFSNAVKTHLSFSVPNEVISAGLGFDVTKTTTFTDSYQVTIPEDKVYKVVVRPVLRRYTFEVWSSSLLYWGSDYKVGEGTVEKPVGLCFCKYEL